MADEQIDLTIFVACYNEEENIVATLDTVVAACREVGCKFEIVIVDDASTDRSVEIIQDYRKKHKDVPIILKMNPHNEGLGNNFAEAAFLGHGTWYRLVCGDNVEPKETLVKIFSQMGKAEMIIPYRPQDVAGRGWSRRFISRSFTSLVNLVSGHKLHYYNGMPLTRRFYVMRWHSNTHGFGFQADLITRLLDRGVSYIEVPVSGQEREKGASKALTLRNFCSVAHSLLTMLIRRVSKIVYGRS
jgi:glycosyltransferase involved in cell wall biosynthesis